MTSTRLETPAHTPGAHRAHRRAPHSSAQRPPARYEPHLDGLFTYCLSVLCDHEAATEALGAVLVVAERQDSRCPTGVEERKSWLYALARWMCLRKLTEQKRGRQAHRQPARGGARAGRRTPGSAPQAPAPAPAGPEEAAVPAPSESPSAEARRRELAQLAWPEAAGTTPEQREALELAVRHQLPPRAVAAVLGLEPVVARELLAAAACEVERTRAALAVVETGNCPTVARLTGDHQVLLSAALRRELVRHVDDCPRCRRAAERAGAGGPWPGATVSPTAVLPVVEAPLPSVQVAMAHAQRSRSGGPRFDRAGFPLDPKDHAARRDRLRARVLTATVVATVVAAPVIALWAAYRGAPQTGEGHAGSTVAATERDGAGGLEGEAYDHYENAGNARPDKNGRFTPGARTPDVSAEVISTGGRRGPGSLAVTARTAGDLTTITLTASGNEPVPWSAWVDAPWLHLSSTSGTLAPGRSVTIRVSVNHAAEPDGPWRARVGLDPEGSVVVIDGYGATAPPPGDPTGPSEPATPSEPAEPSEPTPTPTDPAPSPDPTTPTPTDPTPTEPTGPPPSPGPSDPTTPTDPGTSPTTADPTG
ncbi:BACON domain-containing protein [Streptomyces sp. 24-1644]|uniref:BACON domain-containing protein n=1 Tax=Streptomyces sp. 24-1644 TaxID=3457315 RepID=UPI003FA74B2E